jgi:hypothetical protein
MLKKLQQAVIENKNVVEVLTDAVRVCSLGQITTALFKVGGQYSRNVHLMKWKSVTKPLGFDRSTASPARAKP